MSPSVRVVLCALCLGTAAASAAGPTPTRDHAAELATATADVDALRLEAAAERLEALVADPATPPDTLARAWLWLGLTRAGLVDERGARQAFARALTLAPGLELPTGTSPKVRALYERARAEASASQPPTSTGTPPAATTTTPDPLPPATTAVEAPSSTSTPSTSSPPADAPGSAMWVAGVGGALLAGAAASAVGAALADDALGTPVAGRTRAEHDQIRGLGLVGLGAMGVLGAAGLATLAFAALAIDDGAAP